ncbi:MAG: thermonuclease family protein [Cyanothece sp. SIO1E1]|nr:thermonuclease family protein [Cyanothece sp. SIO1E1]
MEYYDSSLNSATPKTRLKTWFGYTNSVTNRCIIQKGTPIRALLEPDAVKVASPVLRGEGSGNAPDLPDPPLVLIGVRNDEAETLAEPGRDTRSDFRGAGAGVKFSPRVLPRLIERWTNISLVSEVPESDHWQVVSGSVYDGDTLRVQRDGEELKIRFCGIDAPEKDQPLGIASRDHLRSLIDQGDRSIIVVPIARDRYGRMVAELFMQPRPGLGYQLGEEIFLNGQMVADGYAYHYGRYAGNCPNGEQIGSIEQVVREQGLGVWAEPEAVKPWEWRRQS